MQSILSSAINPSLIYFHLVACERDQLHARHLAEEISDSIKVIFLFDKILGKYDHSLRTQYNQIKWRKRGQKRLLSQLSYENFEIIPFSLPNDSGFRKQLFTKVMKQSSPSSKTSNAAASSPNPSTTSSAPQHHWNSPIGTDVIRFYLPSIFPQLHRILYLDNDIIVNCCIEEIYWTSFSKDKKKKPSSLSNGYKGSSSATSAPFQPSATASIRSSHCAA
jgi:hypothetical protein